MRFFTLIVCLCFYFSATYGQGDVKQSLIVVHVDPAGGSQFKQLIYSYHFLNGSFTGRDELMSVTGRKDGKDYIRTDAGNNTIYKDRYLITGIGNIIDLKEKKVLFDGRAALVRCSNDSAVFYTNDIFKGKFYSVYDFKSGQYAEVKDLLFKAKPGADVEFDKTATPFKLYYYPQGKPKVLLCDDAGYGQLKTGERHVPDPPLWWLDEENLAYAHFNKENAELCFYKISLKRPGAKKIIAKVQLAVGAGQPAVYSRLPDDGLLLQFDQQQVFVDLKASTATVLDFTKPSHGFSMECNAGAQGRCVKLNNKEVGRFHFRPANFKADNNIAALVKEITVGSESYQQGLAVWNAPTGKWAGVEAEDVLTLAGWINE